LQLNESLRTAARASQIKFLFLFNVDKVGKWQCEIKNLNFCEHVQQKSSNRTYQKPFEPETQSSHGHALHRGCQSRNIPFASVGRVVRLKETIHAASNRNNRLALHRLISSRLFLTFAGA